MEVVQEATSSCLSVSRFLEKTKCRDSNKINIWQEIYQACWSHLDLQLDNFYMFQTFVCLFLSLSFSRTKSNSNAPFYVQNCVANTLKVGPICGKKNPQKWCRAFRNRTLFSENTINMCYVSKYHHIMVHKFKTHETLNILHSKCMSCQYSILLDVMISYQMQEKILSTQKYWIRKRNQNLKMEYIPKTCCMDRANCPRMPDRCDQTNIRLM